MINNITTGKPARAGGVLPIAALNSSMFETSVSLVKLDFETKISPALTGETNYMATILTKEIRKIKARLIELEAMQKILRGANHVQVVRCAIASRRQSQICCTTSMGKNRPALRINTPLTHQHSASWREGRTAAPISGRCWKRNKANRFGGTTAACIRGGPPFFRLSAATKSLGSLLNNSQELNPRSQVA